MSVFPADERVESGLPRLAAGQYYGDSLRRLHTGNFELAETLYAPHLQIPRHSHEHAYFCLVISGCYTETAGRMTRSCGPESLLIHPVDEPHADRFLEQPARLFSVEATRQSLERLQGIARCLDEPAHLDGGPAVLLAKRLYQELRHPDSVSPLAVEGLVLELLAAVSRGTATNSDLRSPHWIDQVADVLRERYRETLSLDEIADIVEVHPVSLARAFRKRNRCTIGEFVRCLRIDDACRKLATTELSLGEIALAAGFSDQSHFNRSFKSRIGLTPGQYRAAHLTAKR